MKGMKQKTKKNTKNPQKHGNVQAQKRILCSFFVFRSNFT